MMMRVKARKTLETTKSTYGSTGAGVGSTGAGVGSTTSTGAGVGSSTGPQPHVLNKSSMPFSGRKGPPMTALLGIFSGEIGIRPGKPKNSLQASPSGHSCTLHVSASGNSKFLPPTPVGSLHAGTHLKGHFPKNASGSSRRVKVYATHTNPSQQLYSSFKSSGKQVDPFSLHSFSTGAGVGSTASMGAGVGSTGAGVLRKVEKRSGETHAFLQRSLGCSKALTGRWVMESGRLEPV